MVWHLRIVLCVGLNICLATFGWAQVDRYVVFFDHKDNTPYSVDAPEAFLGQKSIQRRQDQAIAITAQDLPVDPAYVENVNMVGVDVLHTSRWFNASIIAAEPSLIPDIEALPFVTQVQRIAAGDKPVLNSRKAKIRNSRRMQEAVNRTQLIQTGLNNLHDAGYTGTGMTVAFFDSGYEGVNTTEAFRDIIDNNRLIYTYNLPEDNTNVFVGDDHGTETFSIVGGFLENEFTGTAYNADFALFITEDISSEYPIEEYNWLIAAEKADSLGVDIINSSLGYNTFDAPFDSYVYADMDGNTTVVSRAADLAAAKGMLVVTSAGNEGNNSWGFILAPADADSVISVGSVGFGGQISAFSSFGPSSDGRTKPEVVALGQGTFRINRNGTITQSPSGTSVSSPIIAGFATCLWQAHRAFTNMQLRDTILSIGDRAASPDNRFGYGIPQYGVIITSLEEDLSEASPLVHPNPHRGNSFRITNIIPTTVKEVNIYDVTGSDMGNYQWNVVGQGDTEIEVVTEFIPPGGYIVQLKSATDSWQFKILKY